MKLFHKIFLCFVVIFGITFQTAGYLLVNFAYQNAVEQQKKLAFQNFQYNKYILQSILYSEPDFFAREDGIAGIAESFAVPVAVYGIDGEYFFSNLAVQPGELAFDESGGEDYRIAYRIYEKAGENYIFVCDDVVQGEKEMYLITQTKISPVIDAQKRMTAYFQRIYFVLICVGFPVIFLLTKAVTAPIKKVRKAAGRIAGGE
ncbi:MAG: hypothetical protein K2K74_16950, partial [Lachnospiraceae bacterium]|nr:hypothetical protein [Lachnospiraceae bacterium]